ncbi:MAG TPA: pyridoxal phosphate-dependent aminotransferase [Vicinamibacterales bacterium]|nr:pyridoxal phosphate-dependent aminotransferase [Vicinamibacterales bacterium]
MRPSSRLPRESAPNALSQALDALRRTGTSYIDLTESNPTHAGIAYPEDLLLPLSSPAALRYEPHPLGLATAREAIAADCARRGARVEPEHVVLSASTSETYSWLFKLLCDAGESVLVPRPSYPLFEHLTRLEGVRAEPYRLEYHGRWDIDLASVAAAPAGTRAVLLVSPNNPTGSYASAREIEGLARLCRDRGWALIVDEVFADYVLDAEAPVTDLATRAGVLAFSMGGASKSLGLPQVKLGWTVVGGPAADRAAALAGLELIADTFLSVGTPVQVAAVSLLERGAGVRAAIHARVRANLAAARRIAEAHAACDLLPVEGGWSAVVRVPATRGEEALVLDLLSRERILVHPGYFFDFEHEAFLVVSLLVPEAAFAEAFARTLRFAEAA